MHGISNAISMLNISRPHTDISSSRFVRIYHPRNGQLLYGHRFAGSRNRSGIVRCIMCRMCLLFSIMSYYEGRNTQEVMYWRERMFWLFRFYGVQYNAQNFICDSNFIYLNNVIRMSQIFANWLTGLNDEMISLATNCSFEQLIRVVNWLIELFIGELINY